MERKDRKNQKEKILWAFKKIKWRQTNNWEEKIRCFKNFEFQKGIESKKWVDFITKTWKYEEKDDEQASGYVTALFGPGKQI